MSEEQQRFDPIRHLTKVSGRDYLEVKWRLVWFNEVHPDGSIATEMIQHQNNSAVFKASVSWPTETGIATRTGYGSEDSGDFGDYLEKAETKAIGRALGAAGFGTQFCDDHVFGAEQGRVVDSPVERPQGRQQPDTRRYPVQPQHDQLNTSQGHTAPQDPNLITPKQVKFLHWKASDNGYTEEELHAYLKEAFGVESSKDLTKAQASKAIDYVQGIVEPQPAGVS